MKKLLLVLMVVAMASFLFVGCIPSPAPDPDPDPDPDPVPTPITATIAVATETPADADGKVFVKGGSKEITVTFSEAVENPVVKVGTVVVPVFTVDDKVFKGTGTFVGDGAVLITVSGVCDPDLCAAKSVVVDSGLPFAELKATVAECECDTGYALTVTSDWSDTTDCGSIPGCCGDDSSGLATWNVKIYDEMPWEDCCVGDPCVDPIAEADGTACPVTITTECIDEVYTPEGWVDFFTNNYWVIATLTDKVGNTISYYGEVYPDAVTEGIDKFVELFYDPTSLDCLCDAENPALADAVIGDCDGTPTTECWVEPLEPCPEITLDPEVPVIGEEVTITIDYADAVKPTGTVSAYVSPAFKILPVGIPEGSSALPLEKIGDYVYEANVTFGEAGDRIIYVVDACEDCPPCTENITILPLGCPEITIASEVEYPVGSGVMWIAEFKEADVGGDDHVITVAFDAPIETVRVFVVEDSYDWEGGWIIPDDAVEILMTTDDNKTFTGAPSEDNVNEPNNVFDCGSGDDSCDEEWIYVLYGESCCPVICTRTVMIDDEEPCVELAAVLVEDDCSDCDPSYEVIISSDTCAYEDPVDECCEPLDCCDECTTFDWTLTVYADQPFEQDDCLDCILDTCAEVVDVWTGTTCPVDANVFGCLDQDEWDALQEKYFVILETEDIVGNSNTVYGVLTIDTGAKTVRLGDAAGFDPSTDTDCLFPTNGTDTIMGDPCSCLN